MSKAIKCDATLPGGSDVTSPTLSAVAEWWLTFRFGLTAPDLTAWTTALNSTNLFEVKLGGFVYGLDVYLSDPAAFGDYWAAGITGAGSVPPPVVGWQDCEVHYDAATDTVDFYIGGALVCSGTGVGATGQALDYLDLGVISGSTGGSLYFADVVMGTTRGASDLFDGTVEDDTFDAWDGTSGDVTILDDPFVPPMVIETAPGGEAPVFTEVPESPFPLTTNLERSRITVSQDSQSMSFRVTLTDALAKAEIYAIETDARSYWPEAEGE